jgi:TPR repeat protein
MLKKCDFDNTDARYELGHLMLNDGHWLRPYTEPSEVKSDALMHLSRAAHRAHVDAMCLLGEIYLKGLHEQDVDAEYGLEWLTDSAELGSSKANLVLADHYLNTGDKVKANDHYKKSAELGSPKAKFIVATKAWNNELSLNADETILEYINDALSSGIEKAHFLKALYLTKQSAGKFSQEAANEYKIFINSVFDATPEEILICVQYFIKHKCELELAHQIIMHAAIDTQNTEGKQAKEVFAYLNSLIQLELSKTGIIYKFHPHHLLPMKELVVKLNQVKIANALSNRPRQLSIPKNFPRNELCPCGSNKKYKVCHYLK